MDSAQDPASQDAARWYSRLRAPDCTAAERAEFEQWVGRDACNAAAYAAAERLASALEKLAASEPRLKAMVDQAASAGATLPEDAPEEQPRKSPPLAISATPSSGARRRLARPFAWAASVAIAAVPAAALLELRGARPQLEQSDRYARASTAERSGSAGSCRAVRLAYDTVTVTNPAEMIELAPSEEWHPSGARW
jgi:ferric-dicitrate binding protein FerR (iron transport regulator)